MAQELLKNHTVIGLSLKIVGIIVTIAGFVGVLWATGEDSVLVMVTAVLTFFLFGPLIWRYGLRIGSPLAEVKLKTDHRPPVLYFRSFSQEEAAHRFWQVIRSGNAEPILPGYSPWPPMEQYQFNKLMNRLGPYIAIGRPGELLPEPGAARLYVSDDEWQDKVIGLLDRALFIVIRAGASPGLQWEISQVLGLLPLTRILLITPPRKCDYKVFRDWLSQLLPKPLPQKLGDFTRLIIFSKDGTPILLDYHGKLNEEQALEPFFTLNNISLPKKSIFSRVRKQH